jgi:hypothetical protein
MVRVLACGCVKDNLVTSEQSKKLMVGDRVFFNRDNADGGKVTAINVRYVTIKWDDGHQSFSGHRHMDRVQFASAKGNEM